MNYERIIERIKTRCGFSTTDRAEQTLRATLTALGAYVPDQDKDLLFHALPEEVQEIVRCAAYEPALPEHALPESVLLRREAALERIRSGAAIEHAQIVCETIAEALPGDGLQLLRLHLPAHIAELFQEPEEAPQNPPAHGTARLPGEGTTLASGRPGSHHPLASSRPQDTLATARRR